MRVGRALSTISYAERGEQAGFGGDPFFETRACRALSAFLLAAALGGHRVSDVQRWLRDPAESPAVMPPRATRTALRQSGLISSKN